MSKYVYFVSGYWSDNENCKPMIAEITTDKMICSFNKIKEIGEDLARKYKCNQVVITNFKLMRVE